MEYWEPKITRIYGSEITSLRKEHEYKISILEELLDLVVNKIISLEVGYDYISKYQNAEHDGEISALHGCKNRLEAMIEAEKYDISKGIYGDR